MQESNAGAGAVSVRTMEIVTAGVLLAIGAVVAWDSYRVGARWGSDGPEAGYFPFYVGLIIMIASAITLITHLRSAAGSTIAFVERSKFALVVRVLIPAAVFVVLIGYLGIYVSAALYIAFFMAWLGKYKLGTIVPVAVLVPIAMFLMFEIWFLVPLPKGPLEAWLGY
jgi:putative tricarboxylic transport membrane protein